MPDRRIISVNRGIPRDIVWNGQIVSTSIFKEPVAGRVRINRLGLEGDKQADLTVHGGPKKALYAYPSEHYDYWKMQLGRKSLEWGMFGENLTTQGLLEGEVRVEDEYRIGSATVLVTQPRFPCYKLGIKFRSMEMVKRYQVAARSGFYLSVVQEGEIGTGDEIELVRTRNIQPTIVDVFTKRLNSEPTG
jgi:MOSC domain-containing protein YiiM